jgi:predicted Zn-dependent protease
VILFFAFTFFMGFFYNLGRMVGPKVRKARWIWHSMKGTQEEIIQTEYDVGRDLAREIRDRAGVDTDPLVEKLLSETGFRLSECVANKFRTFSFKALVIAEPNAFALPGGFIFVTRSILELCQWNADETAFIIAHEMGHVIRKHAINRIMRDFAVTAASRVVPAPGAVVGWVRKVSMKYLESSYSQDLEFEADALGVRLMDAAGFSTQASIKLLQRLGGVKSSQNQIDTGSYFSTHPGINERIRNINEQIRKISNE